MGLKPMPKTETSKEQNWVAEPVRLYPNPLFLIPMMHTNLSAESSSEMSSASAQASSEPPAREALRTEASIWATEATQSPIWQGMYTNKKVVVWCLLFTFKCGSPHLLFLKILFSNVAHYFLVIAKYLSRSNTRLAARGHLKNGMQCFFKPSFNSHTTDTHYSPEELPLASSTSHH